MFSFVMQSDAQGLNGSGHAECLLNTSHRCCAECANQKLRGATETLLTAEGRVLKTPTIIHRLNRHTKAA